MLFKDAITKENLLKYYVKSETNALYIQGIEELKTQEYRKAKISSKGFYPEIAVQDFPISRHRVYLHIRRRRWFNEDTGKMLLK